MWNVSPGNSSTSSTPPTTSLFFSVPSLSLLLLCGMPTKLNMPSSWNSLHLNSGFQPAPYSRPCNAMINPIQTTLDIAIKWCGIPVSAKSPPVGSHMKPGFVLESTCWRIAPSICQADKITQSSTHESREHTSPSNPHGSFKYLYCLLVRKVRTRPLYYRLYVLLKHNVSLTTTQPVTDLSALPRHQGQATAPFRTYYQWHHPYLSILFIKRFTQTQVKNTLNLHLFCWITVINHNNTTICNNRNLVSIIAIGHLSL